MEAARMRGDEFARRVVVHATALATLRYENPRAFREAMRDLDARVVAAHPLAPVFDVAVVIGMSLAPGTLIHVLLEEQVLPEKLVLGSIGLVWRLAFLFLWWWFGRPARDALGPVAAFVIGSTLWANFGSP